MKYGLIGEKLGHSFSKEIHNQIGDYDYILKEIPKNQLQEFMQTKDFCGINVTIPYKQDVIPFLDYVDEAAKEIGAVNTIVNRDGKLFGYNTDFIGLKQLILSVKLDLQDKKVLILGTGGTSKTAMAVAKSLGAKQILRASRSGSENAVSYDEIYQKHKDVQIIINATPCGMFPKIDDTPICIDDFICLEGVVDVIYNPLRSVLVLNAQNRGLKAQGGLFMLVGQAIAASQYFFDNKIDADKINQIYRNLLAKKQNIVLTGMPGCGKTTIGKKLATQLGCQFFDVDEVVTQQQNMSPAEIISKYGETKFRDIESDVCKQLSTQNGVVIATGGGSILRPQNVIYLKNNGKIFFIDRDINNISPTDDRPLSDNLSKLQAVYNVRYPIYKQCADVIIKTDENMENTIAKINQELSK